MASTQYLFILAIIAAILVPSILATEFVVGDDKGWTINFDYQSWTQGKEFHFSSIDREGAHNVLKVNSTSFQQCTAPAGTKVLTSGNDVITLTTPKRQWYICGVAKHCEVEKQRLVITVLIIGTSLPFPSRLLLFSPNDDGLPKRRARRPNYQKSRKKFLQECLTKGKQEYTKTRKVLGPIEAEAIRDQCNKGCNDAYTLY
ncbi:blue copper protein 1a-like [Corylus avellana]|uniref:blue copper protein 1a-like n=1 Tax=Corylus avellana TaxID=13451 RepID=UPI00286C2C48|nr:blue copper protein 1a-like [Corylus avellana]